MYEMFLQRQSPKNAGKEKLHFGLFLGLFFCSIITYMIDEMAIYLKALEFQGLFRILGAKNIFHFYGCEIPKSETRTSDFIEIVEKMIIK